MKCIMEHNNGSTIPVLMCFMNNTKLTHHMYFNLIKNYPKFSSGKNDSSLNSDDFIFAVSIFYHICLQPLLPCKQPWYLDIYSSQKIIPEQVPTINIKAHLKLLLIRYYHPSFLFVEFISKLLQSYGRFSFYWIYNGDIRFHSNNF